MKYKVLTSFATVKKGYTPGEVLTDADEGVAEFLRAGFVVEVAAAKKAAPKKRAAKSVVETAVTGSDELAAEV